MSGYSRFSELLTFLLIANDEQAFLPSRAKTLKYVEDNTVIGARYSPRVHSDAL
jgi:hypothetical protein